MNSYNIYDNLVINLIIVYLLILSRPDYAEVFRKYMSVAPEL